jgi:hypothetical protein
MQVAYQRCAAIDVGKDVIALAVRLPGDGPGGRATIKRMFKASMAAAREEEPRIVRDKRSDFFGFMWL